MSLRKILFLVVCLSLVSGLSLTTPFGGPQPATFRGHTARVVAVVASPDSKTLASMSEDKTIKLWDVATQKELATLQGSNATFSSDSKTLAWAEDKIIKLWNVNTGRELITLVGHTDRVYSVVFSPDGKTLASGSCDTTVKLWDVTTGKQRTSYQGVNSSVDPLKFSPDGKTLASGSYGANATITLWDATTGTKRPTFRPTPVWTVEDLAFSPDGKTLASGGEPVRLWDVATGRNTATLDTPTEGVEGVTFSPDGKTLAAVRSGYPEVYLWDVVSGKQTGAFEKSYQRPRPRLLRMIWDTFPGLFKDHRYVPLSVVFTSDGKVMALGFDNLDITTLKMWQVATVPSAK